ncbi:DUF349 domain-containing protein [Cellulomonas denverensis]|uniref:DUF349 domain-containing protein n=1 Tax=Cellulomonas denverensis TaxID=264297 RepID=UPI001A527EB9|nr:DUF349 domain-containing protein [Cellulomonas denverensis]GIG24267.1 hypothetical protein Cde04nite_05110 [Cellulomonas denverensis]
MTETPADQPGTENATTPPTDTEGAAEQTTNTGAAAPGEVAGEAAADEVAAEGVATEETAAEPTAEAEDLTPAAESVADATGDSTAAAEDAAAEASAGDAATDGSAAEAVDAADATDATTVDAAEGGVAEAEATATDAGDASAADSDSAPAMDEAAQPAAAPAPAPTPATTPRPRAPKPSALRPRPGAPRSGGPAAAPTTPVAPTPAPDDSAEAKAAAEFGRVDDEGTVYVRESAGERPVGQFPGATAEEALSLYVRRFLDLQAKVAVFEARLQATDLAVKEIDQTLTRLTEELSEPAAVGDLAGLRDRLDALRGVAAERRAQVEAERAAAKQVAIEARTSIVEKAEKIAATDPARMQWRPAGEQLRALLDEWKDAQRSGPRIDRPTEEALWKRFSHARTTFDRERRHYFAELETRNASAKTAKEQLVQEAEALSGSTDWGPTAGKFRDLMTRWKAAGRASRQDDDALWARFRAAQDAFFQARDALNAAIDEEYRANLEVKEALLVEAEAIDVSAGLSAAKQKIRSIQDRWEAAGKVPRADIQRVEGRLRAVESKIRDAEQTEWRRTNPETRARAEGAAAQLEQAIAQLEDDLSAAKAAGNERKIKEAQAALDARRSWLEQVQRAANESRG